MPASRGTQGEGAGESRRAQIVTGGSLATAPTTPRRNPVNTRPGADRVTVRLSEINPELRLAVADTIVERGLRRGTLDARTAGQLRLAAAFPIDDPQLTVPADKAYDVLVNRRQPPGQMPRVWTW